MTESFSAPSTRTKVNRRPKRGQYQREQIYPIVDEALICHVGFSFDGYVTVLPTAHWRSGDFLYIHGSSASRMMRALAAGAEACITITLIDGLVLARSAFHHSMNYRSVVIFAKGRVVEDEAEKQKGFATFIERLTPGRWQEIRRPNAKETQATTVIEFDLREASAKIRSGPPIDDEEDHKLPVWAGVIPLRLDAGIPVADELLTSGIAMPDYVKRWNDDEKTNG